MTMKSRHAFGSKANVENAIEQGLIDSYDVLFLNGENESPVIGWIDKDGNPVYLPTSSDTTELEEQVAEIEAQMVTKEQVSELESQMATFEDSLSAIDSKIEETSGIPIVEF